MAARLVCSIVVLPRISRDGTIFLQRSTTLAPVQAAVRAANLIGGNRRATDISVRKPFDRKTAPPAEPKGPQYLALLPGHTAVDEHHGVRITFGILYEPSLRRERQTFGVGLSVLRLHVGHLLLDGFRLRSLGKNRSSDADRKHRRRNAQRHNG